MSKTHLRAIVAAFTAIFLILVLIAGIVLIRKAFFPTAFATKAFTSDIALSDGVIVDRSDLRLCCEFTEDGVEKGCWILNKYDCINCEEYCKK